VTVRESSSLNILLILILISFDRLSSASRNELCSKLSAIRRIRNTILIAKRELALNVIYLLIFLFINLKEDYFFL